MVTTSSDRLAQLRFDAKRSAVYRAPLEHPDWLTSCILGLYVGASERRFDPTDPATWPDLPPCRCWRKTRHDSA